MKKISLTSIEGNAQKLDGGSMFGNVPRPMWEKWLTPDDQGRVNLSCRALMLNWEEGSENSAGSHGSWNLLLETGIGSFFEPKLAERFGVETPETHQLLENLKKNGVSQNEIDFVILSHLHFDHAGGLLPSYAEIQKSGQTLLFPNAIYVVGEEAFARCEYPHPRDRASFIPGLSELLKNSGRLLIIKEDLNWEQKFLSPSLSDRQQEGLRQFKAWMDEKSLNFYFTHGHTPGHMHTLVSNQNPERPRKVFFAGDLIPGAAWVHVPITMGYDRFAEKVIDEKKALYKKLSDDDADWLFFYTHDSQISASRIFCDEKGRFKTEGEQATLVSYML